MVHDVFLSEAAHETAVRLIRREIEPLGGALVSVPATDKTYGAVASHADLYCCALGGKILRGEPSGRSYPDNVGFNGVQLGNFFVHKLSSTNTAVLTEVKRLNLIPVNVRQGYTKCNLVVVDDGLCGPAFVPVRRPAVITSDRGIAKTLASHPMDVLLISPGSVVLPGFPCGFLGGASGRLGQLLVFHGDLSTHPDFRCICDFVEQHHRKPVWFPDFPLTDIGSIITLL